MSKHISFSLCTFLILGFLLYKKSLKQQCTVTLKSSYKTKTLFCLTVTCSQEEINITWQTTGSCISVCVDHLDNTKMGCNAVTSAPCNDSFTVRVFSRFETFYSSENLFPDQLQIS